MEHNSELENTALGDFDSYELLYNMSDITALPESEVKYGRLVCEVLLGLASLVISLTFIVVCLTSKKLRGETIKWAQVGVASTVLLYSIASMAFSWEHYTGTQRLWAVPGICQAILPLIMSLGITITLLLLLATLECLLALWKGEIEATSSSRIRAGVLIGVIVVVSLAVSYGVIFGLGGVYVHVGESDGYVYCYDSYLADQVMEMLVFTMDIILAILTLVLIGRLVYARRSDDKSYPLDKVLVIVIGNVLHSVSGVLWHMVIAGVLGHIGTFYMLVHLLLVAMILVWLLGEADVRRSLKAACCPCCPARQPDGEKDMLLNATHH